MVEANLKMIYRFLGKSGLKVSVLGFGTYINSHKIDFDIEEQIYECITKTYELGINYFDTAEIYGNGGAEINLGKAIKKAGWERKDFVISTKIFKVGNEVNDTFLSRKHIIEGTSMWTPEQIMEAHDVCSRFELIRPIVEQPVIIWQRFEVDLVPLFEKVGLGTTTYSALAGGILTGKYNDGLNVPDARYGQTEKLIPCTNINLCFAC